MIGVDVWTLYGVAAVVGYALGSVPCGLLLTRLAGLGDIRAVGSGNIGATNVLRTGHKVLAALTLVLDGGKGGAAVLLMGLAGKDVGLVAGGKGGAAMLLMGLAGEDLGLVAGLAAVVGHAFPVWLGFKGGKGVATSLGVLAAAAPLVGLLACVTWLAAAAAFRYSSLAALVSLAAAPLYATWLDGPHQAQMALVLALLVAARHHANIRRLIKGEEPKIGARKDG